MSEKSDDPLINAFINPLAFLEVDEPWATHLKDTATPGNILKCVLLELILTCKASLIVIKRLVEKKHVYLQRQLKIEY